MRNNLIKKLLKGIIYKDNSVRKIIFGPSRGLKYMVNSFSGCQAIYGGNQRHIQRAFTKLVKQNMIIYDIGAHCGLFTILLSRLAGEGGCIYSFEPVPYLAGQIKMNVKLNNLRNVTIITKAVSDSCGIKNFALSKNSSTGRIVDNMEINRVDFIQVDATTLDHFIFLEKNPVPQVIKIDVEGGESEVFNGAQCLTEKYRPIFICDLHSPDQDASVGGSLIKNRYAAFRLNNNESVKKLWEGWPSREGLWGSFVGYPLEKKSLIQKFF